LISLPEELHVTAKRLKMSESVKSGPVPRYYQLKEFIRERIRSGEWEPGMLIPSERELCERYGISRMTARQAITELVTDGLLYREQGKGTFVARGRPKIPQRLMSLTGFTQDIRAREQRPGARVLEAGMRAADQATADALRIKTGQPVYRMRRLRLADTEPLAIETTCVNFIGCERLLECDLEHDSLYRILTETFDMPPIAADQEIEADLAGEDEARLLGLEPGDPVLRTRRITTTRRGQPIEYALSLYRGDKYRFFTRLVRDLE
jgi:GntR family transcriptional regulator